MPDFLEVTRQPDRDDWMLSPPDGNAYPDENTRSELGIGHEAVLILHEPGAAVAGDTGPARVAYPPPGRPPARVASGPVSERTARVLPARLSRLARWRIAVQALAGTAGTSEPSSPRAGSTRGPAKFTRPARPSPIGSATRGCTPITDTSSSS